MKIFGKLQALPPQTIYLGVEMIKHCSSIPLTKCLPMFTPRLFAYRCSLLNSLLKQGILLQCKNLGILGFPKSSQWVSSHSSSTLTLLVATTHKAVVWKTAVVATVLRFLMFTAPWSGPEVGKCNLEEGFHFSYLCFNCQIYVKGKREKDCT